MKRTVYITENQKKKIQEGILMERLPEDIMDAVFRRKTSLGDNPALPNIFENGFLEKVIQKRFNETVDELKKIGEINDFSDTEMKTVLSKLILKCQKIEAKNKNELEKICYNYIIDLFHIPEDSVQMELNLVETVDLSSPSIILDPVDGDDELEFEDINQAESLKDEVYKRRMLDVLSMGAGMQFSSNIKSYMKEIYDVDPNLLDLYRKILALNNYLLFTQEDLNMTDENKMQIGTVELVLGSGDEKVKIKAQGEVFPILLSETVRGFMELFASHGLPQDMKMTELVIGKSDYLKAEPWDMRLGPSLWTMFSDTFENVDSDLLPYLYKRIAKLSPKNFYKLMKEVFARTRNGKRLMGKLIEKAREEKEYFDFQDKMDKVDAEKNLITDEFISEEEL